MDVNARKPLRKTRANQDLGAIESVSYNDAAGAKKFIPVQPAFTKATIAGEAVGAGKLVKISVATYTLELKNKVHSAASTYQKGDIVTTGGFVYVSNQDIAPEAFDSGKWNEVATTTVVGIVAAVGDIVSTGRWHNSVSVAGWLVDDDSDIPLIRIRD